MSYIGIGYKGSEKSLLEKYAKKHRDWLEGDRKPMFFGESFLVMYDSNTAREFIKMCLRDLAVSKLVVYKMDEIN